MTILTARSFNKKNAFVVITAASVNIVNDWCFVKSDIVSHIADV